MTDDGDRRDDGSEGQEPLPPHLAALLGGVEEARETVDFRGFTSGMAPQVTPFAGGQQHTPATAQTEAGLPFQQGGQGDGVIRVPAVQPAVRPAADFRQVDSTLDIPGGAGASTGQASTGQASTGQASAQAAAQASAQAAAQAAAGYAVPGQAAQPAVPHMTHHLAPQGHQAPPSHQVPQAHQGHQAQAHQAQAHQAQAHQAQVPQAPSHQVRQAPAHQVPHAQGHHAGYPPVGAVAAAASSAAAFTAGAGHHAATPQQPAAPVARHAAAVPPAVVEPPPSAPSPWAGGVPKAGPASGVAGAASGVAGAASGVAGAASGVAGAGASSPDYFRPPDPLAEQQAREALAAQPAVDEPAEEPQEESKPDEAQRVGQLVQLVWYDEYSVARIRRNPEWAMLLEDLEQQYDEELDDPDYSDEPADVEDRREIYEILTRGKPTDPEMMRTLLLEGIRQGGKVKLPLLLVEGELSFDFDELAELGAVVTTATPYIGDDEVLEGAIDEANEFLEYANPPVGPKVCRAFTDRVRKAFAAGDRPVDDEYFEEQVNRALLTGQCYQLRDVLGERHVRGGYMPDGASARKAVLPCYLPEDMAPELPMFRTFRASMVAELNVREDQYETHPAALRVLAIARVMKTPSGW